jgi:hypothetical protein
MTIREIVAEIEQGMREAAMGQSDMTVAEAFYELSGNKRCEVEELEQLYSLEDNR